MYFLLELGGKSLKNYYRQKIVERNGENNRDSPRMEEQLLLNILKGAAQALQQFHQRNKLEFHERSRLAEAENLTKNLSKDRG